MTGVTACCASFPRGSLQSPCAEQPSTSARLYLLSERPARGVVDCRRRASAPPQRARIRTALKATDQEEAETKYDRDLLPKISEQPSGLLESETFANVLKVITVSLAVGAVVLLLYLATPMIEYTKEAFPKY